MKQRTLAKTVEFGGRGLHTGEEAHVRVAPARESQGVVFRRLDLSPDVALGPGDLDPDPGYGRTSLSRDGTEVQTVEHVTAALYGVGISNATVEVTGPEIPAFDGSALPFAEAFVEAGLVEQDAEEPAFSPPAALSVSDENAQLAFLPGEESFVVSYTLEYPSSALATAHAEFRLDERTFLAQIAPARTFCMEDEIEELKEAGVGRGANGGNTLVIDGDRILEGGPLRFPNEPLRHKVLDLVGDLSFVGARLRGRAIGVRSGHGLNRLLVARLRTCRKESIGGPCMEIEGIESVLPHRYPFLLVDRVIELEEEKKIVALKNVSRNEEFFQGHFPGNPVMPGVLQVEALAQAAGIVLSRYARDSGKVPALVGMEGVRFRRPVGPGDTLVLTAEVERLSPKRNLAIVRGRATVDGELALEAKLLFALMEGGGEGR